MKQVEHHQQTALFRWAALMENIHPELKMLFSIPNGGQRNLLVAKKLKAEGVKAGVPDIFLPISRGGFNGLFMEMKVGKNKPTEKQKWWLDELWNYGYSTTVCYSMEEAIGKILEYLGADNV